MTTLPVDAVFSCPDCRAVLLIVGDDSDPGLPAEIGVKVDGHSCPGGLPTTPPQGTVVLSRTTSGREASTVNGTDTTTYRATLQRDGNYARQMNAGAKLEALGAVYHPTVDGQPFYYLMTSMEAVTAARKAGYSVTIEASS